jgi:hypothetical protein
MNTLHIEHAITDYTTWKAAFDRFAPARAEAGVRSHMVRRPVDDPHYICIDLDFDTAAAAQSFLDFLQSRIWSTAENSPALAGRPVTRVLQITDSTSAPGGGRSSSGQD